MNDSIEELLNERMELLYFLKTHQLLFKFFGWRDSKTPAELAFIHNYEGET